MISLRGLFLVVKDFNAQDVADIIAVHKSSTFDIEELLLAAGLVQPIEMTVMSSSVNYRTGSDPSTIVGVDTIEEYLEYDYSEKDPDFDRSAYPQIARVTPVAGS